MIAVNARYIRGYGVPKYTVISKPKDEPLPIQSATAKEVAKEVIDGRWGNGDERKKKLTDAGYNYAEVQTWVNCILNGTTIDDIARAVIKGRYGNGDARKKALKRLGYDYQVIQNRVNAILRGN